MFQGSGHVILWPLVSASGPCPVSPSLLHCKSPGKKLVLGTWGEKERPEKQSQLTIITSKLWVCDELVLSLFISFWQGGAPGVRRHARWVLAASPGEFWLPHRVSPSALAMWPKTWAKELGMMPLSSGTALTPSMVKVLPVPVCPYAKIVPVMDTKEHSRNKSNKTI